MKAFQTSSLPSVRTPSEHVPSSTDADHCDSQEVTIVHPTIQTWCRPCARPWHTGCRPQQENYRKPASRRLQLLDEQPVPDHATTYFAFQGAAPSLPFHVPLFRLSTGLVHFSTNFDVCCQYACARLIYIIRTLIVTLGLGCHWCVFGISPANPMSKRSSR